MRGNHSFQRGKTFLAKSGMKLILAVFLCGVAYATASPDCSRGVYDQCESYNPRNNSDGFADTEAYLDWLCNEKGCTLDYYDTCGKANITVARESNLKQDRKIYDAFCGTNPPLRREYLETDECVNKKFETVSDKCRGTGFPSEYDPNYCKAIKKFLKCVRKQIGRECGRDARKVYDVFAPDPADCDRYPVNTWLEYQDNYSY